MAHCKSQVPTARLSEENLRRHNESFSKIKRTSSVNGLREIRKSDIKSERVGHVHEDKRLLSCKAKKVMALRKAASRDALGLYTGVIGSWDVKRVKGMSRPMESRCDESYWGAVKTKFLHGDVEIVEMVEMVEPVDLRELVFDIVRDGRKAVEDDEVSVGSLQASSDTLSVSRFREVSKAKKMAARRLGMGNGNCRGGGRAHIPTSAPRMAAV